MAGRAEINAVHEDQLQALLKRLGVAEDYAQGRLGCSICGESVQTHGLGGLRMVDGELTISCGKLECLEDLNG